jgi:hypothetical protein
MNKKVAKASLSRGWHSGRYDQMEAITEETRPPRRLTEQLSSLEARKICLLGYALNVAGMEFKFHAIEGVPLWRK